MGKGVLMSDENLFLLLKKNCEIWEIEHVLLRMVILVEYLFDGMDDGKRLENITLFNREPDGFFCN